ncbi:MAG: hypothetical protein P9M13_06630 [Candidatus Ancaeobacter aquaticus]|nr:hypothetical protein [Candidatus Ancaeobacter aquaticus]
MNAYKKILSKIRSEEAIKVMLAMSLFFMILFGGFLGFNASIALFLKRVGVELLPVVYIINAFFMIAMTLVYSLFADRINNFTMALVFFALDIVLILCLRMALTFSSFLVPIMLFMFMITVINYATIQFWAMNDTLFSFMDSKRLYPLLAAGGTMGAIAAGFSAKKLVYYLHSENLFFVSIGTLGIGMLIILILKRYETKKEVRQVKKIDPSKIVSDMTDGFRYVAKSRLFGILSIVAFLTYLLNFCIDYNYSDLIQKSFETEDQMTVFLGLWTGILNILTIIVQFFFASKIISKLGIGNAAMITPSVFFLGYLGLSFRFSLAAGVFAKVVPAFVRFSIGNPVTNIICYLADEKSRVKVRVFINVFVMSLGMLTSGIILNVLVKQFGVSAARICMLLLIPGIALIIFSLMLKKNYKKAIFALLKSKDKTSIFSFLNQVEFADSDIADSLVESFNNADNESTLVLIDLLSTTGESQRKSVSNRHYEQFSDECKVKFINVNVSINDEGMLKELVAKIENEPDNVKIALMEAIDKCNTAIDKNVLRGLSESDNSLIKIHALKLLFKNGNKDVLNNIKSLCAENDSTGCKIELVRILGELNVPEINTLIVDLLKSNVTDTRKKLSYVIPSVKNDLIRQACYECVKNDKENEIEWLNMVARCKDDVFIPILIEKLKSDRDRARRKAVKILKSYETIPHGDLLDLLVGTGRVEVKKAIVAVLVNIRDFNSDELKKLQDVAYSKLKDVYELYLVKKSFQKNIKTDADTLLIEALSEMIRKGVILILNIVAILKKDKNILLISKNIYSADKRIIDTAIESLFIMKEDELIDAVIPLTYVHYMSKIEKIAYDKFKIKKKTKDEMIKYLIGAQDEWLRITALNVIRVTKKSMTYVDDIKALSDTHNPIEQELVSFLAQSQ